MNNTEKVVIDKTVEYVRETLKEEGTGHDWWHIYRVWRYAINIAEKEKANQFIVQLAILLHDVGDYKLNNGVDSHRIIIKPLLKSFKVTEKIIEEVCTIVENISYSKNIETKRILSLEGKIVQDADRIDALGAIGIARTFAYAGSKGNPLHDPNTAYKLDKTKGEYKNANSTPINHFYEKLLLLKDLMNTNTAKEIAIERHKFMEEFLVRFHQEWEGEI